MFLFSILKFLVLHCNLFTLLGEAASSWVGGVCQETEGGVSGDAQVRYFSEQLWFLYIVLKIVIDNCLRRPEPRIETNYNKEDGKYTSEVMVGNKGPARGRDEMSAEAEGKAAKA